MPESPITATYSPAARSSETAFSTVRMPNRLVTAASLSTQESYYVFYRRRLSERYGLRRIAQRLPARPVLIGHPWHRRLLIYAGLGVVAHASRKRLLELAPLRISEQVREVVGTVHDLELTFRGVVGERLARAQTRRPALRNDTGTRDACTGYGAPIHRIGRLVIDNLLGECPGAGISLDRRQPPVHQVKRLCFESLIDHESGSGKRIPDDLVVVVAVCALEAGAHRPAVKRVVDLDVAGAANVDDGDVQVIGLVEVPRSIHHGQRGGIGPGALGLGVVVDVVPTHLGVEVSELRRRNQTIHQRLQPVLDPYGVERAIRETVANGLFDRTPCLRRPASKLRNAVVPQGPTDPIWVRLRMVNIACRYLTGLIRRREQSLESHGPCRTTGRCVTIFHEALIGQAPNYPRSPSRRIRPVVDEGDAILGVLQYRPGIRKAGFDD